MEQLSQSLLILLKSCTNLPSPPAVASKIIELSSCETSGLSEVADVIGMDPALSAKLLRMANSPLYTQQRKVENLRQAITLFGLNGTLNIALSFSLKLSSNDKTKSGLNYNLYWKRSLASAMLCQDVFHNLGNTCRDSAFLAGLLQDIGMLALDKAKPDLYKHLKGSQSNHATIYQLERKELSVDHGPVGAWLLQQWNLPENLIEPICQSHASINTETACTTDLAKAVAVSSVLADLFITDEKNIHYLMSTAVTEAKNIINFSDKEFHEIIESTSEHFADLAQTFDIDIEEPKLLDFIVEQAKEVLILRNLNQLKHAESLQMEAKQLESKTAELEEQNRRDGLTQLYNRRYFDESIEIEFNNACKYKWPLGLIFIDIDHFKKINDTLGHEAGDEVLRQFSNVLLDCTRNSDLVARYGGEEFTVILPGTSKEGVTITCERIVRAFRNKTMRLGNGHISRISVSAGACVYDGNNTSIKDWYELVRKADQATYQSKDAGRDQYHIVSDNEPDLKNKKIAS